MSRFGMYLGSGVTVLYDFGKKTKKNILGFFSFILYSITAGGELPIFVIRLHAPNRDVRPVTVRYEYIYRSTPNIYIYLI